MTIWHWIAAPVLIGIFWLFCRFLRHRYDKRATPGTGIGGWLALLIVGMTLLGPLLGIFRMFEAITASEALYPQIVQLQEWRDYKVWAWAIYLFAVALSIFGGWRLAKSRQSTAVKLAKVVLWITGPVTFFVLSVVLPMLVFGQAHLDRETVGLLIASATVATIWTWYLGSSKRVRATYAVKIYGRLPDRR